MRPVEVNSSTWSCVEAANMSVTKSSVPPLEAPLTPRPPRFCAPNSDTGVRLT
jgi:hypothetical protein